jgi:hypothetical protein
MPEEQIIPTQQPNMGLVVYSDLRSCRKSKKSFSGFQGHVRMCTHGCVRRVPIYASRPNSYLVSCMYETYIVLVLYARYLGNGTSTRYMYLFKYYSQYTSTVPNVC